ncbi:EpsG family protein [Companilactobacillus farciminis]|uniref:EpsG family protein n=1 Tax=Companilactobacillus farciminis TaxID=1612 RepID=UPI00399D79C3
MLLFAIVIFFDVQFLFYFFRSKEIIKWYLFIAFMHLSLLMGLRSYLVGTDTQLYMNYFLNQNTSYNSNGALIYNIFSKFIFQLANGNYTIFILLMSALSVFFFLASLIKLENDFISVFLSIYIYITYYFYFDSFNMQRQMLAVSIAMYSVCLFIEGKNIKSVLLLLLAIGIHSTAFLALINFFLVRVKKNGKYLTLLILFMTVILFSYNKILMIFSMFFSHYNMYVNSMNNSSLSAGGGVLFLGSFFILISLLSFFMIDIKKITSLLLRCFLQLWDLFFI